MEKRLIPLLALLLLLAACGGQEADEEAEATRDVEAETPSPEPEELDDGETEEAEADAPAGAYDELLDTYIAACRDYLAEAEPDLHSRLDYDGAEARAITEHEILTARVVTDDPGRIDDSSVVVVLTTYELDYTYQAIVDGATGQVLGFLSDV